MNADAIASSYGALSRFVFGNSIQEATNWSNRYIDPESRILIAGGGDGTILQDLDHPGNNFVIDYVELSKAMISLSRRHQPFNDIDVHFHHSDIMKWQGDSPYDVIITPFFLDCFTTSELCDVVLHLKGMLKKDGMWCFTDFVETNKSWQRLLIRVMYWFFGVTTGLKTTQLPDYEKAFSASTIRLTAVQSFYHGMIESRLYQPS